MPPSPAPPRAYRIALSAIISCCAIMKTMSASDESLAPVTQWMSGPAKWGIVAAEAAVALSVLLGPFRWSVVFLQSYALLIMGLQVTVLVWFPAAESCGCLGPVRSRGLEIMAAGLVSGCCLHYAMHHARPLQCNGIV
jgi:hypothetical protein